MRKQLLNTDKEQKEVGQLSDKELKDKTASEENNPSDEDLLDTHPPEKRSTSAGMRVNTALGRKQK